MRPKPSCAGGVQVVSKVHADRPYLFPITERATGAVLFMGRVANPDPG